MKKENQGYTLVELIVTVAILALVGIGIGTIVSQALKNYRISNAQVNLQQESQLVGNQLMNLVFDASDGVSAESGKLNIYNYNAVDDVRSKTVIAYNDADGTLTYTRYEATGAEGGWLPVEGETEECLAEYVTGFSVALLDEMGARLITTGDHGDAKVRQVTMHILYELNGESYDFDQTVTLRNRVLAGNITEEDTESGQPSEPEDTETEQPPKIEEPATGQIRIYLTDWWRNRYDAAATLRGGNVYWFHIEAYDETTNSYQEIDWGTEVREGHLYAFTDNSGNTIANKKNYLSDGYISIRNGEYGVDRKTYDLTVRYNGNGENPKDNIEYEAIFTITTE